MVRQGSIDSELAYSWISFGNGNAPHRVGSVMSTAHPSCVSSSLGDRTDRFKGFEPQGCAAGIRVSEFGLWGIKACGMESLCRGSEFRACGLNGNSHCRPRGQHRYSMQ